METNKLLKKKNDLLKCQHCIFNDGCEKMFNECVANFVGDMNENFENEFEHLKYCNQDEFNTLTTEEQEKFIENVVIINEKYKNVKTNVK